MRISPGEAPERRSRAHQRAILSNSLRSCRYRLGYHAADGLNAMTPNRSLVCAVLACGAILLGGCALFGEIYNVQEIENWAKDNEPLAESGRIPWSQFYAQYLEKVAAVPASDQAWVSERLGILMTAARLYEEGRLDKAAFDSIRGIVRTYRTIDDPAANTLARTALVSALKARETAVSPPGR
jgi:hypothetical protein